MRDPSVLRHDSAHPLADDPGAHAVNDAEEWLLDVEKAVNAVDPLHPSDFAVPPVFSVFSALSRIPSSPIRRASLAAASSAAARAAARACSTSCRASIK